MNQVKHKEVLKYIREHPGMPVDRICRAFGRNVYWTLRKLEDLGKVEVDSMNPDFLRKKNKIYFAKRS